MDAVTERPFFTEKSGDSMGKPLFPVCFLISGRYSKPREKCCRWGGIARKGRRIHDSFVHPHSVAARTLIAEAVSKSEIIGSPPPAPHIPLFFSDQRNAASEWKCGNALLVSAYCLSSLSGSTSRHSAASSVRGTMVVSAFCAGWMGFPRHSAGSDFSFWRGIRMADSARSQDCGRVCQDTRKPASLRRSSD